MQNIVAGLGNPGEEYARTRHNVGRMVVEELARMLGAEGSWREDAKARARVAETVVSDGIKTILVLPDNYMNRSGGALVPYIRSKKAAERLVVVHDDIDLPFGTIRVVCNRGSGGHRGVESIERALKTRGYMRVRVGVLSQTPSGKVRKPKGESAVHSFILKPMSNKEMDSYAPFIAHAANAVLCAITEGLDSAMRTYNGAMDNTRKKQVRRAKRP